MLFHNLSIFVPSGTIFDKLWNGVIEAGWVGVQLFFVLSGFLITGILLDDRGKPRAVRVFYIRRALRIFPLYYALLFVYFVVLPPFFPFLGRPLREVVWYAVYLSNWSWLVYGILPGIGHLWSLAVEEQFYLVWPWAARRGPRVLAWISLGVVIGSLVVRGVLHRLHYDDLWLYSATVCRADALAMGALVAIALRSDEWRPRLLRLVKPAFAAASLLLLALMAVTHGLNRNNPLMQIWGYSLIAIGSSALVAMAAETAGPPSPRLHSRVLRFFGKYSYGMYLVHPPLKHVALYFQRAPLDAAVAARPIVADAAFIAAISCATIVVALLTWRFIERPLLGLKDRLAPR